MYIYINPPFFFKNKIGFSKVIVVQSPPPPQGGTLAIMALKPHLIDTDLYGKKMFQFIGPRVFNKIVDLEFFKRCNNKVGFKTSMKKYLIDN